MNNNKQIIKVACAIICWKGKIFVARRKLGKPQGGKWEFPGGKVEPGETVEECLTREFFEEFGVKIKVGNYCGTNHHNYDSINIELIAYYCEINCDKFSLTDHDKIAWLTKHEIENYDLAPADIPLIKLIN